MTSHRWYDTQQVTKGQQLYDTHCVSCHRDNAVGAKNWKHKDKSGFLPPPPLNGDAHTWHHDAALLLKIMDEGGTLYDGVMPGFKEVLSQKEKLQILAYIQHFWDDETYRYWMKTIQKEKTLQ